MAKFLSWYGALSGAAALLVFMFKLARLDIATHVDVNPLLIQMLLGLGLGEMVLAIRSRNTPGQNG